MYLEGYKEVFSNHSATACLIGTALSMAGFQAILLYSASFFRERFLLSTGIVSLMIVGGGLSFILGAQTSGYVVNNIGRQPSTVVTAFLGSIFTIAHMNVYNPWLALVLRYISTVFFGMLFTAAGSLTLEQVPSFRGTMTSMQRAAWSGGGALGAGIGGLTLIMYDYNGLGLVLGALSLVAALTFYFFVRDPTKPDNKL